MKELSSLLDNLDDVADGGAACRFLIGRYGSGKSFLIQLIRGRALERGFICADADLSPERRLSGGNGAGLATYKELMINMASKASPDGGALPSILSRHYAKLQFELADEGVLPDSPLFESALKRKVILMLEELEADVGGFDFARVLGEYYTAMINDNLEKKDEVLNAKIKQAEEKLAEAESIKKSEMDILERISGFTKEQAKEYIISALENDLVHE